MRAARVAAAGRSAAWCARADQGLACGQVRRAVKNMCTSLNCGQMQVARAFCAPAAPRSKPPARCSGALLPRAHAGAWECRHAPHALLFGGMLAAVRLNMRIPQWFPTAPIQLSSFSEARTLTDQLAQRLGHKGHQARARRHNRQAPTRAVGYHEMSGGGLHARRVRRAPTPALTAGLRGSQVGSAAGSGVRTTAPERNSDTWSTAGEGARSASSSARTRSGGRSSGGSSCAAAYGSSAAGRARADPGTNPGTERSRSRTQSRRSPCRAPHHRSQAGAPHSQGVPPRAATADAALRNPVRLTQSSPAAPGAYAAASSLASVASSALAAGGTGWTGPTSSSMNTACRTACALAAASVTERPSRRHRGARAAGHAAARAQPCAHRAHGQGMRAPEVRMCQHRGPARPEHPTCASAPPPAPPGRAGAGLGAARRSCESLAPSPVQATGRVAHRCPRVSWGDAQAAAYHGATCSAGSHTRPGSSAPWQGAQAPHAPSQPCHGRMRPLRACTAARAPTGLAPSTPRACGS